MRSHHPIIVLKVQNRRLTREDRNFHLASGDFASRNQLILVGYHGELKSAFLSI